VDTDCRCQIEHHPEHKKDCKVISNSFLHCVICDRTVDAKVCTGCYRQGVCDLDQCVEKHSKTCTPPKDITETALRVDVRCDTQGNLSVYSVNDIVCITDTSMKNLFEMLIYTGQVDTLTDRYSLVYVTFGGTHFEAALAYMGPMVGITLQCISTHEVCPDGVYRTPTPTKLEIIPGGGGLAFDVDTLSPLQAGVNFVKLVVVVIPVENTTPASKRGSNG
jgi:hypothetical protein